MSITRWQRPEIQYTRISNSFARSTLKARAIKVGLYVMSHVADFRLSQESIGRVIGMSTETVAAALRDLEAEGLLIRVHTYGPDGYREADEMMVTDIPFTPEEASEVREHLNRKNLDRKNLDRKNLEPKKTIPSKKNKEIKKTNPPGGLASPAASDEPGATLADTAPQERMEEPVTAAHQAPLFEVPPIAPPAPREDASAITGAFVDAYRVSHGGESPLQQDIRKVAGTAKKLLGEGARFATLCIAATQLGGSAYTDLAGQYRRVTSTANNDQRPGARPMHLLDATEAGRVRRAAEWEAVEKELTARNASQPHSNGASW